MSTRAIWTYVAGMVGLGVLYFAYPPGQAVVAAMIGFAAAAVGLLGVRRNQPDRAVSWLLLLLAVVVGVFTRATYDLLPGAEGTIKPGMSLVHLSYVSMFVLFVIGLAGLSRHRGRAAEWTALVDGTILVLGLGLLAWVFLVVPLGATEAVTVASDRTPTGYPFGDVLLLAATARLATAVRRSPATVLLVASMTAVVVNNVVFWVGNAQDTWLWGTPADLLWMTAFTTLGAAALHPSMVTVHPPPAGRVQEISTGRLALLALASLIPAAVMLTDAVHEPVEIGPAVVTISAAMLVLVLARLAGVAYRLRHQSAREKDLRQATADLVAASNVDEVRVAVDAAVGRFLPAGASYRVVLNAVDGEAAGEAPRQLQPGPVDAAALPDDIATELGGAPRALTYPLVKRERAGTVPIGVLAVAADDASLTVLRVPLGTLAAATTLALDRIRLSREVIQSASEQYFRALVQNAADVIVVLDDDDRIRYASPAAATLFGDRDLAGMSLADLIGERDDVVRMLDLTRAGAGCGPWDADADWTVRGRSGRTALVEISCRDLRDDPSIRGRVLTLRDVTEQRRLERELTRQAFHDPLTGLPNRVLFGHQVQEAIAQGAATGGVTGVLLIDLDEFKLVNDALGHDAGDAYLISVGQRLIDVLSPHGFTARLGGDEFAGLVVNAPDPKMVDKIAERVVEILGQPVHLDGQFLACGASVGVATTTDVVTSQELMHQADLSLYAAKEAGKGRWRHYEAAMHSTILSRLEMRSSLENALAGNQFRIEYQPIVDLNKDTVVGYEALLRWQHPTRGRVTPAEFIDVAEESGLIVPIGDWVLKTAIATAARWRKIAPVNTPYVAVNVSARQFQATGFVDRVGEALAAVDLPPSLLMLEITESLLLRDDDRVWEELHHLRDQRVRIAIDDFGTGYSALSYLRQVPLDVIKIDRLFVSTVAASPQQRAVFEGIVNLAHTLGLSVVAEGIEDAAERDLARQAGCAYGQGFHFSRPVPESDVLRALSGESIVSA